MARTLHKLTALGVDKITEPGRHGDGGGLYLAVDPNRRRWVFLFRDRSSGRHREMGLGSASTVTLKQARAKAAEARKLLEDGLDPLAAAKARAAVAVPRFDALAEEVCVSFEGGWRNPKTAARWRSNIRLYAGPLAAMRVDAIATADVEAVLAPIWQRRAETASQLRGNIERVLAAAKARGFRTGENPAAWKNNLDSLLPEQGAVTKHYTMLPWRELPALMQRLRAADGIAALALEFAILTAARGGEVRHATWNEIDGSTWTVPAEKMKEKKIHAKPLSARALELLAIARQLPPMPWDCGKGGVGAQRLVFPGAKGPLSDMSMAAVLKRLAVPVTVHGMRRTFRTWCGDTQAAPREIAEMCLAHTVGNEVERAYNASTYLDQRRALMLVWGGYCGGDHGSQ